MKPIANQGPATALLLVLLALLLPAAPAWGADKPAWLTSAEKEAATWGYTVIDNEELHRRLQEKNLLLLDVRPDYEFKDGHLPGAVNLEFDLSDSGGPSAGKSEAFRELAGPDTARPIVIYCRSFR